MNTCVEWRKGFKYLDEVDEYNIEYKNGVGKAQKLVKFLDQYATGMKRVNIGVYPYYSNITENDIDLLVEIIKRGKYNCALCAKNGTFDEESIKKIQENGIKWYINTPVKTWEEFWKRVDLGCSDVIIYGELGFDLERLAGVARGKIRLRVYVNLDSYTYTNNTLLGFFIRPEDIEEYAKYIDVFEFFNSEDKQNVLYDVYFHDREWNGNLREIIKGLDVDVNNYYILGKEFAQRRIKCNKKCIKGDSCNLCNEIKELADTIENSSDYDVFIRRFKEDGEGRPS